MFKTQSLCHVHKLGYRAEPALKRKFTCLTVGFLILHTASCLSMKFAMGSSQYYLEIHFHCHVAALHIPIQRTHTLVI